MDAQDAQEPQRGQEVIDKTQRPGPRPLTSSSPRTQYLILYNFASAVLWFAVLGRVLILVPLVGFAKVYKGTGNFTKWTQTMALLEVVHAASGIVRAPIGTTAMQVASRLLLVWGVVNIFPSLGKSAGYSSMLYAWSVTEVIRYSFFVVTLSGYKPGFIKWLRYNTFYFLYPLGISSECYLIYQGVQKAKDSQKISYGQELAWLYQLILFIYIPGSYILFTHMMAQRRKVIRGKQVQKAE